MSLKIILTQQKKKFEIKDSKPFVSQINLDISFSFTIIIIIIIIINIIIIIVVVVVVIIYLGFFSHTSLYIVKIQFKKKKKGFCTYQGFKKKFLLLYTYIRVFIVYVKVFLVHNIHH